MKVLGLTDYERAWVLQQLRFAVLNLEAANKVLTDQGKQPNSKFVTRIELHKRFITKLEDK